MERLRGRYPVSHLCRALGVPRSSFYARRRRDEPARIETDRHLKQQILSVHASVKGRYGTPRVERQLRREGTETSRKRVARLRRELDLRARQPRRFRITTDSSHTCAVASNLLKRRFTASRPNEVWVGDITYLVRGQGWLYLALLMDVYSRRIVGWSLSDRIDEALTLSALDRAVRSRRPPRGLIHHTDRGSQYVGAAYRQALEAAGIQASMSRKGDCWDNAMAESVIKTIKVELGSRFASRTLAEQELFEYIEGFYNTRRLHSSLDYQTPAEVERKAARLLLPTPLTQAVARPAPATLATASPTLEKEPLS